MRTLQRVTNLFLAFLFALLSVNLSGVLSLQTAYADPPGNNGTIKIGAFDAESNGNGHANVPHVGCQLDVKFFGFDTGARAGTVTFETQAPTAGQLVGPVGPQPVSFTGSGPGNALDHTEPYTLAFKGEPQKNQGYHVKATVTVDGAQGSDTKYKTFWVESCEPTKVTPTAPTFNDECGSLADNYIIPATDGVKYEVKLNNGLYLPVVANTYTVSPFVTTVSVKAVASSDAVILQGDTMWSHIFNKAKCDVTAAAPEKIEACGSSNDAYTIPTSSHVTYKVRVGVLDYDTKPAGTYSLNTFQKIAGVKIIADADPGYTITGTKSWDFNYSSELCGVPAAAPTKIEACGTSQDKYVIPTSDHVKYYVNLSPVAKSAGEYQATPHVLIVAIADSGYIVNTQSIWLFSYNTDSCPTTVTPGLVTSTDTCGTAKDGYTIPVAEGVTYKNDANEVLTAGFHAATGTVTITAEASNGYVLDNPASWTFTYTDTDCEPEPCTPSMIPALSLENLVINPDCIPGKGSITPPADTPPVTLAASHPLMLPETGPSGNNLQKIAYIVFAGITTYIAMFYALNRRTDTDNK